GLLLPAVQSAREAGRRNTCSNNINQMGKATIAYEGQQSQLPGWRNKSPNPANNPPSVASFVAAPSWPVMLLPNLERRDIYQLYENPASAPPEAFLSIYTCPTSPPDTENEAWLSYVGNIGTAGLVTTPAISIAQQKADAAMINATVTRNNLDVISSGDGTSNTLLVSERSGPTVDIQAKWNVVQEGFADGSPLFDALLVPGFGFPDVDVASFVGKVINNPNDTKKRLPSSGHPNGVVVGYCDGHTSFLTDAIAPHVYGQLLTSNSSSGGSSVFANSYITFNGAPYVLSEGDY
ncbi:MAG: DUF1559 domain-containing protein, partial [Planctomycetota bacterium]|nr:DUF1559 domain-containing protein [Planctomycetota bacterium]